jgi:hypothetical protein
LGLGIEAHLQMQRLRDFGDTSKLAKADQYFSAIMTIPRIRERLDCMQYRRKLDLEVAELRPELGILRDAARELKASARFKQVLQVGSMLPNNEVAFLIHHQGVLAIGNALNGSTFRGGAQGFQLESLLKVCIIPSTNLPNSHTPDR